MVTICNFVVTTRAPTFFDSKSILSVFPNAIEVPHFFAYKVRIGSGCLIVFANGHINLTGFKCFDDVKAAFDVIAAKLNFDRGKCSLSIQNITGTAVLPFKINFNAVCRHRGATYEP